MELLCAFLITARSLRFALVLCASAVKPNPSTIKDKDDHEEICL
jgi:hypothetical protein